MTEDVEELLARLRAELGEARFRELLRDSLEAEQRRRDDAAVNAHLDAVAAEHTEGARLVMVK